MPRFIQTPDGLRTGSEIRAQAKLNNKIAAAKADAAIAAAKVSAQAATDRYADGRRHVTDEAKNARRDAARARVTARLHTVGQRLADDRPLLAALVVAGVCLVATFAGQIMVYKDLNWHGYGWLAYLLPVIVEGTTWSQAIYASYAATHKPPLPYARHIRVMWLAAGWAAGSNTWHFSHVLGDTLTGAILGGASLVGPFVWHRYVNLTRDSHSGRTAAQIKAALLQRIYHPRLSARTTALWAELGGNVSRDRCWQAVWVRHHGHTPGAIPGNRMVTARNRWLFRKLFGRVVNPALQVRVTTTTATRPQPPATRAVGSSTGPVDDPTATGATATMQPATVVDGPTQLPPGIDATTPDVDLFDALEQLNWDVPSSVADGFPQPEDTLNGGATATLEPRRTPRPEQVANPDATDTATSGATARNPGNRNPQPQPRNRPQPPATPGQAQPAQLVAEYYRDQVANGCPPADVNAQAAADYAASRGAGCTRQAASKQLNKLRTEADQ